MYVLESNAAIQAYSKAERPSEIALLWPNKFVIFCVASDPKPKQPTLNFYIMLDNVYLLVPTNSAQSFLNEEMDVEGPF